MRKSSLILLILFVSFFKSIKAEPLFIYFDEMIQQSKLIAKGTYLGFNGKSAYESTQYYFVVEEIIKGKTKTDTIVLNRAQGSVGLEPGTKCVAFVNNDNGFEWVGIGNKSKQINDETLLFLSGFYDWNAYLVSPSMISYKQLKEYVNSKSYSGSIYGDVYFFNMASKQMEASPIHIEINYSLRDDKYSTDVKINGLELNDFDKQPLFYLPSWDNIVTVEYEPNLVRPLTFKGKINNLHPSATRFRATFWVTEPEELGYDEFLEYIKDTRHGPGYFDLTLQLQDKTTYTIRLNDESGIGRLLNFKGQDLKIGELSTAPERLIVFGYPDKKYKLILDSCVLSKDAFEFAEEDLVFELKHHSIGCKLYDLKSNSLIQNGILSYKETGFTKNVNYGK